jgi:SM-20-related protein
MPPQAKMTMQPATTRSAANARCPHLAFRDVLGAATVADLLDYVTSREKDFAPSSVRNRHSGEKKVDRGLLDALYLDDLGAFRGTIDAVMRSIAGVAVDALHLVEPSVEPRELEMAVYRDGGHFGSHIDTGERLHRVRVLSCVYYFAATPRRFSGGELRLHGLPVLSARQRNASPPYVDIAPETDTLVIFPSWLRHEVLPVRVPSGAWVDSRFTINCWLHRVNPCVSQTAAGS